MCACPQKENGYTPIANEIMDALCGIRISGEARQCLDVIIRKTYGFNKRDDYISLSQFSLLTKMPKPEICRSLRKLYRMNLVIGKKANDTTTLYRFNKDFDTWKPLAKKPLGGVAKMPLGGVAKMPIGGVAKMPHTKDNITKEILSAKAECFILLGNEVTPTKELTNINMKTLGKKTMAFLAYKYLDAKGIKLGAGESYDANKIAKGLSKLYHECKEDPQLTADRIKLGAEYFKSKNLDWTPEAVWRRWEDIAQWSSGQGQDISLRRKL